MGMRCCECGKRPVDYKARRLCSACYQWLKRNGGLPELPDQKCANCQSVIRGRKAGARFCSDDCRVLTTRAAATQRQRREIAARKASNRCRVCAADISRLRGDALYCGRFCSERSRGLHLLGPSALRVCALPECGAEFEAFRGSTRTCCETHLQTLWKREARAEGRAPNPPWNDRRRNNYHKRRALKAGSSAGPAFSNATVCERNGWLCGLCD